MNPAHPGGKRGGVRDSDLQHLKRRWLPQIGALPQAAPQRGPPPEGLLKPPQPGRSAVREEGGRKRINQPVALLALFDQPQGHPLRAGVEVQEPSL